MYNQQYGVTSQAPAWTQKTLAMSSSLAFNPPFPFAGGAGWSEFWTMKRNLMEHDKHWWPLKNKCNCVFIRAYRCQVSSYFTLSRRMDDDGGAG